MTLTHPVVIVVEFPMLPVARDPNLDRVLAWVVTAAQGR